MEEYLKSCGFDKYFKKLVKRLKGKTVIVYGTGSLFKYIQEHYDLSQINIIGVSDNKYLAEQEGEEDSGYKIIPKTKLSEYETDVLLLGVMEYVGILCDFASWIYKDKNTKILPLVRVPLLKILKKIWFE